ncbi:MULTISPECIES: CC0125/CC1285 family lipoprotein [Hydrocarboniphaga]|jgi:hypothetical protein|uniref:CC0125/CC1285 family lipoprotein n=1 Tax=Hydrocarboniphaga TaxID=243627 RepID=UPI00058B740C|nr:MULTISPECIES: hypothetical protein [Hydrocarboniphaga]MDZ4076880.1 hypothetical protein [Hydrocarboniphaga sp.]
MRTFFSGALTTSLALALAACATATPYQPVGKSGSGYAEQRLESNRYKITFAGNSITPRQTVENYLLYRSAEVTLQNGYDYFVLADNNTDSQTSYSQTFGGGFGSYYWGPWGGPGWGWGGSTGTSIPRTEYQAQANILVFKGEKPANDPKAFNAHEVKANLESVIVRPQTKG